MQTCSLEQKIPQHLNQYRSARFSGFKARFESRAVMEEDLPDVAVEPPRFLKDVIAGARSRNELTL